MPRLLTAEPAADPFGERGRAPFTLRARLLGGEFRFLCETPALLGIVRAAYARLPAQALPGRRAPRFRVHLTLLPPDTAGRPPRVAARAGAGLVCGVMGQSAFVSIDPQRRRALIAIPRALLRFPYHVRYELLEFAVYVLAARALRLAPLHAACVGRRGAGALLIGASGAGKSTLALHCLLSGLEFLAEDSVLVEPRSLRATGVANFLHVRPDSLRFVPATGATARLRRAPRIRRRSGVEKLEVDLREGGHRLARRALRLCALVFVSPRRGGRQGLLTPLRRAELQARLSVSQRYAAGQPGWSSFAARVRRLPAYELRRARHPRVAAELLRRLLEQGGRA